MVQMKRRDVLITASRFPKARYYFNSQVKNWKLLTSASWFSAKSALTVVHGAMGCDQIKNKEKKKLCVLKTTLQK